ncbi:MAG: ADP compounds hydrolase NudE [Chromatiales bacterium]|nr:ADP compounds hydrolase NudE [Chromatiales bacterium]
MSVKPEVLARRTAAQTRIFRIEEMDLRFSNGATATFERIVSPRAGVMVVAMPSPDEILLIREYAAGLDRYETGFPKGLTEPGESPEEAALRELREETGLGARRLDYLRIFTIAPAYIDHGTHLVLARELYPAPLEGDEPEIAEQLTWRLDDSVSLLQQSDFTEARAIAALFLVREHLRKENP